MSCIVLDEPLSLWGGLDPATGELIDIHHPQVGAPLAGRVVAMPSGPRKQLELVRARRGDPDGRRAHRVPARRSRIAIVALGALVAAELYGIEVPVVVLDRETYAALATGTRIEVDAARDRDVTLTAIA